MGRDLLLRQWELPLNCSGSANARPIARARPSRAAAAPRKISRSSGAPVWANEPTDVVATVPAGVPEPDGVVEVRLIGVVPDEVLIPVALPPPVLEPPPDDPPPPVVVGVVVGVELVLGSGQVALALPPTAPCTPQRSTGTVRPLAGSPEEPTGVVVVPASLPPVHTPLAEPSRPAATEQRFTGASTGAEPVCDWATWSGSHELVALPATAATMLQPLTGTTASIGAPWLAVSVGRPSTRLALLVGVHEPVDAPSTSAMTPQRVTGT